MIDAGLYAYALEQGAGVGCDGAAVCYSLYSGPSIKARILPVAVTTTQSLWQETALMWEDRQTELRDARGERTERAHQGPGRRHGSSRSAPGRRATIMLVDQYRASAGLAGIRAIARTVSAWWAAPITACVCGAAS